VRARDNERIVEQAKLLAAEEIDEADTALAATLDAPREALAAALIKLLRGPLPAPEELADTGSRERLLPTINRERDAQMSRQMQLNQQLGQLTGALNQQKYMAELAGGAQSEAGATTRTMLTAPNPYAASSFQYRG
jgi:hypothetical protein